MATTKERLLITLGPAEARAIRTIAKREQRPRATIAARAVRQWLEDEEERELALLIQERDAAGMAYLSHAEFWKQAKRKRT